jgi:hypothetical protein
MSASVMNSAHSGANWLAAGSGQDRPVDHRGTVRQRQELPLGVIRHQDGVLFVRRGRRQGPFQFGLVGRPGPLHLVEHPHRCQLVDADHHGFAPEAAPDEVPHDVRRDLVEPFLAGDQVVLLAEHPLQLPLLVLVQFGVLDHPVDVVVQLLVGQLKLRDAVLVEQRHGRAVVYGLLEIVDADVVAEDLLGLLFAHDQRRAGESYERRVRQGIAYVQREDVVLGAVGLIGHHDDVRPARQLGEPLASLSPELLDQRKHVAVIFRQQLRQMLRAGRPHPVFRFGHRAHAGEVLIKLVVEFGPVGHPDERPVARYLPQHLLREEHHRVRLAAPLRLPEHPQPSLVLLQAQDGVDGVVDTQVLMVLRHHLSDLARPFLEQGEILHQVQQPLRVASPLDQRLQ